MTRIPVCIFAKPPVPGRVKTRLARSLGDVAAAQLASAMLCDIWSVVASVAEAVPVLAAAEAGAFDLDVPNERMWLQQPGDLGRRIEGILQRGLLCGPAAIALGADSPLLTGEHIREAITGLRETEAVLGPAEDGGFYLLGVRHCPPGLLADLPWSSEETGQATCHRLQAHGMRVASLRTLPDIDTRAELEALQQQLEHLPGYMARSTRRWFDETAWSASLFRR